MDNGKWMIVLFEISSASKRPNEKVQTLPAKAPHSIAWQDRASDS
jgi:hypothetical protein